MLKRKTSNCMVENLVRYFSISDVKGFTRNSGNKDAKFVFALMTCSLRLFSWIRFPEEVKNMTIHYGAIKFSLYN